MRNKVVALLCLAFSATADGGIDFRSNVTETTTPMGFKARHFTFGEKGREITYEAPNSWAVSGGGASIRFTPPELIQAQAEITQVPLPAPQNFDEPVIKQLRETALASLPPDSQQVEITSEAANPIILNSNQSYGFIISYQAFGQEFMTGLIYLNLPDTQLRFRTVARKADFTKVHDPFRASLFSWQWK